MPVLYVVEIFHFVTTPFLGIGFVQCVKLCKVSAKRPHV